MNQNSKPEVVNRCTGESWVYSDTVKDHFFKPRNLLLEEPAPGRFDAEGVVGSPACGDVMRVWLKIEPESEKILEFKWKTFGCGSAIAASSMFSELALGKTLVEALAIRPQDVSVALGGLPNRKLHCSVLIDKAFEQAVNEYFRASGQPERIVDQGGRVVDERLHITDRDIEAAVIDGARTVEDVQKKLKVGIGDPAAAEAIAELVRFYVEKYYG